MKLFKYRAVNKYALDILARNRIYFASISEFNDPFDGGVIPTYRFTEDGMRWARERALRAVRSIRWKAGRDIALSDADKVAVESKDPLIKNLVGSFLEVLAKHPGITGDDILPQIERAVEELNFGPENSLYGAGAIDRLAREASVFSLSERSDHILMWSHYADSHRGFCIEFDFSKMQHLFPHLRKVKYSLGYPDATLQVSSEIEEGNVPREFIDAILFTKALPWSYEEEWRILRKQPPGTEEIPEEGISGIVFGCRMPEEDQALIKRIVGGRAISIRKAVQKRNSFELEIVDGS